MTPELARIALEFLNRATLQGVEIAAYLQVQQALSAIARPDEVEARPLGPNGKEMLTPQVTT